MPNRKKASNGQPDRTPVLRLEPEKRLCPAFDPVTIAEFRVAAHDLTGVPLQDMPIRPDVLLCCINRRGKRIIPRGQDILQEGDTVIVVSTREGMNDLQDIFLPRETEEQRP